eukprot:COSAG06_NODE_22614_length_718_cov_0.770598_1_plen_117_part_01
MPPKRSPIKAARAATVTVLPEDSPLGARAAAAAATDATSASSASSVAAIDDERLQRRTVRALSVAMFCQFFTSTMVQQAQIEVALRLSGGNRSLVISRMSLMQSFAAAIQFLITPLF